MTNARLIDDHRATWETKPALRAVYADYHQRIASKCNSGRTLEIGSGGGNMSSLVPNTVSIDIQKASWLDVIADALFLPFADGSFENIIMLDVLHHLRSPRIFMSEVTRVLTPSGRLIMIEPEITPLSYVALSTFHPEPVILSVDPLSDDYQSGQDPEDANQAIPHLLFRRHRKQFEKKFPELRCLCLKRLSTLAYPLSGGFRSWCLVPRFMVRFLLMLEDILMPLLGPLAAFRLLIVIERKP